MPFTFRVERTLDDPAVQSIFFGPTLLAVQHDAVGSDLKTGLLDVSFYRHVKLDGDLAPAMTPGDAPMHFRLKADATYMLAPFYVADPGPDGEKAPTKPYHVYVRRHEPQIVFGSIDAGVPNRTREDGLTFLDVLWDQAPFVDYRQFRLAVGTIATAWQQAGRLTPQERTAIVNAAARAERDLRSAQSKPVPSPEE
jgi:hypothetical protein